MIIIFIILSLIMFCILWNIFYPLWHIDYGVTFVAGEIGSGKSSYCALQAQKHIKRGWIVYSTNYIKNCFQISVDDLIKSTPVPKSLIIIDESALSLNSRNFAKISIKLIEFMKLSRHCKCKVLLNSQTFGDTDKQIRECSTKVIFIRTFLMGLVSLPVRVKSKLGINLEGQPCMQYKIGHIAIPCFIRKAFKYFDSYELPDDINYITHSLYYNDNSIHSVYDYVKPAKGLMRLHPQEGVAPSGALATVESEAIL